MYSGNYIIIARFYDPPVLIQPIQKWRAGRNMAIELYKLSEYLEELRIVYEEAVYYEKSIKELNKMLEQIKYIQRLIDESEVQIDKEIRTL